VKNNIMERKELLLCKKEKLLFAKITTMGSDDKHKTLINWLKICGGKNRILQQVIVEIEELRLDIESRLNQLKKRIHDHNS